MSNISNRVAATLGVPPLSPPLVVRTLLRTKETLRVGDENFNISRTEGGEAAAYRDRRLIFHFLANVTSNVIGPYFSNRKNGNFLLPVNEQL
jgi:hypothetical protein